MGTRSDHDAQQVLLIGLCSEEIAHALSCPQDADILAMCHHFAQLMRDEQNGGTLRGKRVQER